MVLISRQNRRTVYTQLFNDGVMVVKKDFTKKEHDDTKVQNLQVLMLLKSLASRNLVTCKFSWGWNYYILNDEGIEYMREFLALPATAAPLTMTKQQRPGQKEESARPERQSKWGRDQE